MATGIDYRRTDQRSTILENPFWLTSGIVTASTVKTVYGVLFSFPKAGQTIIIEDIIVQNIAAITAGTTIDIGLGTIVSDITPTVVTAGDADSYIKAADTVLTIATCWGALSATGSPFLTARVARTWVSPRVLTGAASTVPVITAFASNAGAIAAGTFRVHVLVTILPGT